MRGIRDRLSRLEVLLAPPFVLPDTAPLLAKIERFSEQCGPPEELSSQEGEERMAEFRRELIAKARRSRP